MPRRPSLFSLASAAARRAARRGFNRSPVGKVVRAAQAAATPKKTLESLANQAVSKETREALKTIQAATGPIRYSMNDATKKAIDIVLGSLGPLGQVIKGAVQAGTSAGSLSEKQWDSAVDLIQALGGEVLVKPGQKGHERGLEAAQTILKEAGIDNTGGGRVPPPGAPASPAPPDPTPPPLAPDWTGPRGKRPPNEDDARGMSPVHLTPASSNVYGFQYDYTSSTFYVWFRPPNINQANVRNTKGGGVTSITKAPGARGIHQGGQRENAPGPLYAYHDVPVRIYKRFLSRESAGGAVWDMLRKRGSAWGHQFRYSLIAGSGVPGQGGAMATYVPRRATARGFKRRAVAEVGTGKRRYAKSGLPERGLPKRGTPNRGGPNNGQQGLF